MRTEATDLGCNIGQDRIDGREDGPTVAAADDELGHGCDDQHGGLSTNLLQSLVQICEMDTVDELSRLHRLSGSYIQPGHISAKIGIANHRKKSRNRHPDDVVANFKHVFDEPKQRADTLQPVGRGRELTTTRRELMVKTESTTE